MINCGARMKEEIHWHLLPTIPPGRLGSEANSIIKHEPPLLLLLHCSRSEQWIHHSCCWLQVHTFKKQNFRADCMDFEGDGGHSKWNPPQIRTWAAIEAWGFFPDTVTAFGIRSCSCSCHWSLTILPGGREAYSAFGFQSSSLVVLLLCIPFSKWWSLNWTQQRGINSHSAAWGFFLDMVKLQFWFLEVQLHQSASMQRWSLS